jgi:KDO2-lipid IV(A) lauroyltransferase
VKGKRINHIINNFYNLITAYPLFLVGVIFLGLLPASFSLRCGELLGYLAFVLLHERRRIALFNLEIAIKGGLEVQGNLKKIVQASFMSLGRSVAEISMLFWGREKLLKNCTILGEGNFLKARKAGRGVLFFTGHCGNWELTSILQGWLGHPVSVVARPLDNPYINMVFEKIRQRYSNRVIHKKGALKKILKSLKNKETIGILIDQSVSRHESVVTEFFGEKVFTTRLLALIALKTNAVVLPAFISYQGKGRHIFTIGEEIPLVRTGSFDEDIVVNTQNFTDKVEEYIRKNPTQWLWLHRRWKLRYGRKY